MYGNWPEPAGNAKNPWGRQYHIPGEFKAVMDQLLMLSHEIRDKEIARTLAEDQRRRKYLRTIGQKYGIHLGQNEDPFEF